MKAFALSAAALALALTAFSAPASAQRSGAVRDGVSSTSVSTSTDAFGNRRTVIRRMNDNGFARCRSITVRNRDRLGDNAVRTIQKCRPDF